MKKKPDAVIISNALLLGISQSINEILGVPIICTLQGEDGFLDSLPEPYRTQAWRSLESKVEFVDVFVPVSHYYAHVMKGRLNIPSEKCVVVQNGISLDGYTERIGIVDPPTLGYIARLCQIKGLDRLVAAFINLKKKAEFDSLRLSVAGTMTNADQPFVEEMKAELDRAGVSEDFSFHPNISANGEKYNF